ncbi:Fe-S cluster assembly protein SufD, partial [Mycolicibacter hiberniae]|nr:Fe-S cluster assembly protein SufD [Mycolicibacter hiberniae]
MTQLTQAVEGSNKGELFSSYDVEAFEVPGGRDELWRFTPLRRLRGLHDGSAVGTADPAVGVTAGD